MKHIWTFVRGRLLPVAVASVSCLIGFWVAGQARVREFEFELEQRLQVRFAPAKLSDKIVIVQISPEDNKKITGADLANLPRHYHKELIEGLKAAGAKVVIFDLLFQARVSESETKPLVDAVMSSAPLGVVFTEDPHNEDTKDPTQRNGYRYYFEPPYFLPDKLPPNVRVGQAEPVNRGPLLGDIALLCRDNDSGEDVPGVSILGFCLSHGVDPDEIKPDWDRHELHADTNVFQMDRYGGMIVDWPPDDENFGFFDYLRCACAASGT